MSGRPSRISPGVIRNDESYSASEFRRRVSMGSYAFQQARNAGLRVVKVGQKLFIRGRDWNAFLDAAAEQEHTRAEQVSA